MTVWCIFVEYEDNGSVPTLDSIWETRVAADDRWLQLIDGGESIVNVEEWEVQGG